MSDIAWCDKYDLSVLCMLVVYAEIYMLFLGGRWETFLDAAFAKLSIISFFFMPLCTGNIIWYVPPKEES